MNYFLIFAMDTRVDAPEGAGWYVYVRGGEEPRPLTQPKRVPNARISEIAHLCDNELINIVESGNNLIVQSLKEQIEYAEEQARRIAQLRRTLDAESLDTVEDNVRRDTTDHRS